MIDCETKALAQVESLSVTYAPERGRPVHSLHKVSFAISAGEIVGVLGESGSGKSTLASALLRLLPWYARCETGSIRFRDLSLLDLTDSKLRTIRGAQISLVPQDPARSLNPVMRVGEQIAEVIRAHLRMHSHERRSRVLELLQEVGFEKPGHVYRAYPHQLSGGERQRIAIAQAIACRPALVVADEPTSKLDASLKAGILKLISELRRNHGTAFLIISHDAATFAGLADRIFVMYAGRIVEDGLTQDIFGKPLHPYTQALLRLCARDLHQAATRARFATIAGEPPDLTAPQVGCPFAARCPDRMAACETCEPGTSKPQPRRGVSCFKYEN